MLNTFIASNGTGIARAEKDAQGAWSVAQLLQGQDVRCLLAHPLDPAVVYAGTQGQGVLCSADRGRTWHAAGLRGEVVKSLAASPRRPERLYAGTRPAAIFASHDGGATWAELEGFRQVRRWYWFSPAEPPSFAPYVLGLSVSPADPDVIVAGIEAGAVLRSEDGGQTWAGHCPGADRDCHSLTFHSSDGRWAYEGGGGGAAVSRDGGRSWRKPKAGLDRRYCWACAADPERPEVWYVSASPGFSWRHLRPRGHVDGDAGAYIFRSSGGAPWEKLGGSLPQPLAYMAYALLTNAQAPGHLWAGLSNGDVWHSADYGDSWRQLPFNLGAIRRTMIGLP